MKPGFYSNALILEDYHKAEGLSKSALVNLSISPAHYMARLIEPYTFPAADLGTATHLLILDPDLADKQIVTPPKSVLGKNGTRNTNAYREWCEILLPSAIILNEDDYNSAQAMRDAVLSHPTASEILSGGHPEVSAFWEDGNGIIRKTRPDYLSDYYAVNIKTTISAEPSQFGRQAYNLKYHWDAAWCKTIMQGLTNNDIRNYVFIAVEKESPFAVAIYEVQNESINIANSEINPVLEKYRICLDTGIWPGYSDQIEPLRLPKYAYKWEV